ncbi:unnamed protein product [Schistosoma curassoni]|uniref:Uncharacterized protein n=1 Tax=Schistosoma curassoni TaxID=6186 RepID=A0A183KG60_9TREM|nr:unnamed protein product [Schistosoma curassoni]
MRMKTNILASASASSGFNIHKRKSKILKFNTKNTNQITSDGTAPEDVESFTYLRSIIGEHGGRNADVIKRIGKTRTAFRQLNNI